MDGFVAAYRIGTGAGRIAQPARLLRRSRSSVRLEPRRPVRAVRPLLLVGAGRQRLEPPVRRQLRRPATPARTSCRRRAIRTRPRSSTGSRLRASRGASTSRTTTRRTRSPTPSWASGPPSCSRCHCWRCRACVRSPRLTSNIVDMQEFYRDAQTGRLPAVSYIAPGGVSEHPPAKLVAGQTFVRSIVNELMRSPRVEQHRVRAHLRQLGRLVRPRPAAEGGSLRLRLPSAGAARQPVRETRRDRPRHARLHVDPAFHRGQLAARSARAARRERQQHRVGVRLLASAPRPRVRPGESRLPDGRRRRIRAWSSGRTEAPPCSRSR